MTTLAHEIVDNLIEGRFSDEDMSGFADAASYVFTWVYNPHRNDSPPPAGTYHLTFKLLSHNATGDIYLNIGSSSLDRRNRMDIRFSVNIEMKAQGRASNNARTRLRGVVIQWEGLDALKLEFEEFIRGPVTALIVNQRLTTQSLTCAVTRFLKKIVWTSKVQRATPEEIEQLKQRFDYGQEKGPDSHRHSGMFEDPRAEGKETDYDYLTSEDVQFWNMLADEYESRNRAK